MSDFESVKPTLAQMVAAFTPSPIEFPAPVDPETADRIEATAVQVQETFPYRTLLDCRTIAAQLVDAVLTWDAEWPEAEGDCGCYVRGLSQHRLDCIWAGATTTCACSGVDHRTDCPEWTLPL